VPGTVRKRERKSDAIYVHGGTGARQAPARKEEVVAGARRAGDLEGAGGGVGERSQAREPGRAVGSEFISGGITQRVWCGPPCVSFDPRNRGHVPSWPRQLRDGRSRMGLIKLSANRRTQYALSVMILIICLPVAEGTIESRTQVSA